MAVLIRFGEAADVDTAVSVYERSALARREGDWPNRAARVEQAAALLHDPASWFVVAHDGPDAVGMACALPLRSDDGAGPTIPGVWFLNLIFVVPERGARASAASS